MTSNETVQDINSAIRERATKKRWLQEELAADRAEWRAKKAATAVFAALNGWRRK